MHLAVHMIGNFNAGPLQTQFVVRLDRKITAADAFVVDRVDRLTIILSRRVVFRVDLLLHLAQT